MLKGELRDMSLKVDEAWMEQMRRIKIAKRTKKSMKWCDHGMVTYDDHDSGTYECAFCGQHLQDGLNYASGWIVQSKYRLWVDNMGKAIKNKDKILGYMDDYNAYMTKENGRD